MELDQYKSEQVDKYLKGLLDAKENLDFEQEMANNEHLRKHVAFRRNIISGIDLYGQFRDKSNLAGVIERLNDEGFFINEEHIRAYLMNRLDPALVEQIEKRKDTDEAFAKEIEFQKELLKGIVGFDKGTESSKLRDIEEKLLQEGFYKKDRNKEESAVAGIDKPGIKIVKLFSVRNLSIAASILVIIALALFVFTSNPSYGKVYQANFQPEVVKLESVLDELESSAMGDPDKQRKDALGEILILYESKDYTEVVNRMDKYLSTYPNDMTAQFYYGNSLLETGKFNEAKLIFIQIQNASPNEWTYDAKWYLALSYLKIKTDRTSAIILFKEIASDTNSPYNQKAQKIIDGLN